MTYFEIICRTKTFQANLEASGVLITDVTNRGKARVMLHIGADHSVIYRCGSRLSLVSFQTQSNFGKVLAKKPTCNLKSSNIQNSNFLLKP